MNSEIDQEIRNLKRAGLTVREIAARVHKSHQWVSRVTKDMDRPALTVSIDRDTVVVSGNLSAEELRAHVANALRRTASVTSAHQPTVLEPDSNVYPS